MALIDKKILNPIRYHQDNANTVIGQASTMKALFDQGAEDLRVKLNGVIDELLATTGAQQIGIDPARGLGNTLADALTNIKDYMNLGASSISAEVIGTGSGDNVQAQLEWLLSQIQNVVLNQVPDGTITIDKLATTLADLINSHTTQLAQIGIEIDEATNVAMPNKIMRRNSFGDVDVRQLVSITPNIASVKKQSIAQTGSLYDVYQNSDSNVIGLLGYLTTGSFDYTVQNSVNGASIRFVTTVGGRINVIRGASEASIIVGSGNPEGAMVAGVGSLYMRVDGSANTTLYVKQSGTGNTGWAAK